MVGNDKAHCTLYLILAVLLLPYPYMAMPYSGILNTQCVQVQTYLYLILIKLFPPLWS